MTDTELRALGQLGRLPREDRLCAIAEDGSILDSLPALAEELRRARDLLRYMAQYACSTFPRPTPCPPDSRPEDTCLACLAERELARRTP
jgi:hypothetical protein